MNKIDKDEIDKMIEDSALLFESIINQEKVLDNMKESIDVIELFFKLMSDEKKLGYISLTNPQDALRVMNAVKRFSKEIKPFVMKYMVVPDMMNAMKESKNDEEEKEEE